MGHERTCRNSAERRGYVELGQGPGGEQPFRDKSVCRSILSASALLTAYFSRPASKGNIKVNELLHEYHRKAPTGRSSAGSNHWDVELLVMGY
jgi:hypothetical protein